MAYAQPKTEPLYTEEEYLAFEREADERHQYLDGVIYEMSGESPDHGSISTNLIALIVTHLRGKDCRTFTKDMKVRSGPLPPNRLRPRGLFSYPDIVVVCGEMKFLDEYQDVLTNPTVIIEVLSDTTEKFDRQQKFLRYQQYLPSLRDYVLVSQDQPAVQVFRRHSSEWRYTAVSDLKGSISIPSIKCELRLSDIYDRVTFPPAEADEADVTPKKKAGAKKSAARKAKGRQASPTGRGRK
jgi:Uma2 family endonuclease